MTEGKLLMVETRRASLELRARRRQVQQLSGEHLGICQAR